MRLLFDTDVLLDVLLHRKPHVRQSVAALALAETGEVEGVVAAHSLPTVFYLVQRAVDPTTAYGALYRLMSFLDVVSIGGERVVQALALDWSDFEDGLQAACALHSRCDAIVTRNVKDYGELPIEVLTPAELIARGS